MIEVVQVSARPNHDLIIYFADGQIKKYNISNLVGKGVFARLQDPDFYVNNCTVLNHTVAWTLDGKYDPANCLDLDPDVLYADGTSIKDPLEKTSGAA